MSVVMVSAVFWLGGYSLVSRQDLVEQQARLAALENENRELTEDLFARGALAETPFADEEPPYDDTQDASALIAAARMRAQQEGKFLMVTFGANWCLDCRTLHRSLQSSDVAAYTRDLFYFVNVNVGKFNQNRELAKELGVDLRRGIPVAIFFDPHGIPIGTTNEGQLEPARRYSSKQILKFVRDVAERSLIAAPDSVN
jgi:thioredoxin 1